MACRVRSSPSNVFDVFMEISRPGNSPDSKPYILQQYPHNFKDEEITKSVPQFCYPCRIDSPNVLHFSFVLTSIDSKWSFGFIRHPPQPGDTCLLLLSSLPWHDTFYKLLNYIATLIAKNDTSHLNRFLEALYLTPVPQPGLYLQVIYAVNTKEYEFNAQCPDHHKIPSIPEDRNLSEYFNAVDGNNMITIFASMLNERRIIITSKKLSRLSACVQAANDLIYPMYWQHIFIPVLPSHLLDYLSAPMPFLIGVPSSILATVKQSEFGETVILDADENKITTPFDDVGMLPNEIVSFLKKSMKNNGSLIGDGVARTFLKALVMLIGGYQNALRFPSGAKITFDKESFIRTRPDHMQPFLQKMLHLQIFHQFIEDRIRMLTNVESISDEFEFEVNMYEEEQSSHRFRTQYKEWLGQMKKEGGALLKSVNPAVKSAYKQVKSRGKQVKDKSKKAYHGFRLKLQDINRPGEPGLPRSAPTTPRESPTSSTYYGLAEEPSNGPVRKSSSGLVLAKSIISSPSVSDFTSKKTIYGDANLRRDPFFNDSNLLAQAPEASSEDSEIDSVEDEKITGIEGLTYKPINLDLMGELQEVIAGFGLKNSHDFSSTGFINNNNTNKNPSHWVDLGEPHESNSIHVSSSSSSSNPQSRRSSYNLPLPPPSKSTSSSRKSSDTPVESKENFLITLDSSPEDLEAIFDPLLQKKQSLKERSLSINPFNDNVNLTKQLTSSSTSSAVQSGINSFKGTNSTTNNNHFNDQQRPQLPPKPPAQSSIYKLPATTRYNNLSSYSSSSTPFLHPKSSLSSTSSSTSSKPYSLTSSVPLASSTGYHQQQFTRPLTRPDNINNLILGNHSFLHGLNSNDHNSNGALKPIRSNAYINPICNVSNPNLSNSIQSTGLSSTTTNPFTTIPPTTFSNHSILSTPVHHQFTLCGKSSGSVVNSMMHPKCEPIISNSDQSTCNANWQKFE